MVAVLLVRFVSVLDAAAVALNTSVVPITELDGVTGTVSVIVCPLTRLVAVLQTTFWPVVEQPQPPVAVKVEGALTPVGRVNCQYIGQVKRQWTCLPGNQGSRLIDRQRQVGWLKVDNGRC